MTDRTYRSGRDRYERDRYERGRGYNQQAEQFDAADYNWRDDKRAYGQMGDGWREEDYGQFDTAGQSYGRDRQAARDWGRDPSYRTTGEFNAYGPTSQGRSPSRGFGSFTGNDFGGRDFNAPRYTASAAAYGAGSQLAANRGEWRESYGASPSREYRDYRGTRGGGRAGEGRGWIDRASDAVASWFSDDDDDSRGERGYRGHGPSGYTRSDERIKEDACDRLTDDWGVDARQVSVTVNDGEVTLDGTVPSRGQKRRAEDCIDDLSGVRHVQNNLRVQESTTWDRNNSSEFGSQNNTASSKA
jgi:osmotically-inducible protein OsmY